MPEAHGVTRRELPQGEWLTVKGMVRVVGTTPNGAFVLETKPLPAGVRIRRKRRIVDNHGKEGVD